MNKKLSIIIPVFNEERSVKQLLEKVSKVSLIENIQKEIIIINDGSNDNSKSIINDYIVENNSTCFIFIDQKQNKGKGSAIHAALKKVTGDFVIIQDADLEYNPNEYNDLLKPLLNGNADVVYGSRISGEKPRRVFYFNHNIGNKFLTFLSNVLTGLNISDLETCYKLFKTELIKPLKLKEKRFGFEPEITAKISRIKDVRIYEVGISYYGRTYEEGKKIGYKDGFRAIYCILRYGLIR